MPDVTDEQRRDPAHWARILAVVGNGIVGEFILVDRPFWSGRPTRVILDDSGALNISHGASAEHTPLLMRAVLEALEMRGRMRCGDCGHQESAHPSTHPFRRATQSDIDRARIARWTR